MKKIDWGNTKRFLRLSAAAALGLLIADACSVPAGEAMMHAGEAMMDGGSLVDEAGQLLRDAGAAMAGGDAASHDAAAQSGQEHSKSGSRIEMRMTLQKGSDGSVYAGVPVPFDTQLNTACYPTRTTDGTIRCTPPAMYLQPSYFADAACSQRVTLRPASQGAALSGLGHCLLSHA